MRKNYAALLAWAIFLVTGVARGEVHPGAGTTAFPFLNLGYDARSIAMGGASAGMPNGICGILSNPSAAGYIEKNQVMIGFRPVALDVWGGPLAFGRVTSFGVLAVYAVGLSGGELEEVIEGNDGSPLSTGEIARSNFLAGGVTWARKVYRGLALGMSLKGMYHYIGTAADPYKADGIALDAGAQYRLYSDRLVYGVALRNIGFMREGYVDGERFPLPSGLEVGLSYIPRHIPSLRIAVDMQKKTGDYLNFEPGFELDIYKKFLVIRGGYQFSDRDLKQGFRQLSGEQDEDYLKTTWNGLSLGAGINTEVDKLALNVDMAVEFRNTMGAAVVISGIAGF